ncbi:MAG: SIMPL domain-containing protein, partial [Rhodospirillaceae bacterium]|nr:SIMPL domain-containing protein [Rhodospirillaceae bacterium]
VMRSREGGAHAAPVREMRTMSMAAAAPVAPGENEIRVSVSVVFAIK